MIKSHPGEGLSLEESKGNGREFHSCLLTFDFFSWVGGYMDLITLFSITFSIPEGVNLTKEKGYIILPNAGSCDHSMEWHGLSSRYWQHASKVCIFGFKLYNCIAKDLTLEKY